MEKLFQTIKETVRTSGYTSPVDGKEIYNKIYDEIENKGPGSYLFMSEGEDGIFYKYKIDMVANQFNLSYLDIHTPKWLYHIDLDA